MIHLLLVEDVALAGRRYTGCLKPLGCDIVTAGTPEEALLRLEEGPVDLVLVHLLDGAGGGLSLCGSIRGLPALVCVPVLLVLASSDMPLRARAYDLGVDAVLDDPVPMGELLRRVGRLAELRVAYTRERDARASLEAQRTRWNELLRLLVHDLKNPLGVTGANLEYVESRLGGLLGSESSPAPGMSDRASSAGLADDDDLADVGDALRDAGVGIRQSLGLVDDLSVLARPEDVRLQINPRPVQLQKFVDDLRARCERGARDRHVELEVANPPQTSLLADSRILLRAAEGLIDAAVRRAGTSGHVRVEVQVGEDVRFLISRSGPPLDARERELMFERDAPALGVRLGPGLGLYYSRRAAEAHGGRARLVEDGVLPSVLVLEVPRLGPSPSEQRGTPRTHAAVS